MKKSLIISLLISAGFIVACSSGSGSSNAPAATAQVTFLPDGTAVLPDGTHLSVSSQLFTMDRDKSAQAVVKVSGASTLEKLGLQVQPVGNLAGSVAPQDPQVGKLSILPNNTASGHYRLNLVATGLTGSPVVASLSVSVKNHSMVKAAYVDMSAPTSLAQIQSAGYKAANVVIFGFADTTTSATNATYLAAIKTAMASESSGTINLLSIGGATGQASTMTDTATVISNISTQIATYNASLSTGKIDGVDLDLEGGFSATQIKELAAGFKQKGYVVSIAPQVYANSWNASVSSSNPTNLVLTSGSPNSLQNNYQPAIASGNVDYIFAQAYNSGGWTIDGYYESDVRFFKATAAALNNSVKSDCSAYTESSSSICIPDTTYVTVGTVADAGSAYSTANIFNAYCTSSSSCASGSYNQNTILTELKTSIDSMIGDTTNYKYFDGVMMWSLNTDYMPTGYYDYAATAGAFSSTIYGAESGGSSGPYFILQISNTGAGTSSYPYATASLTINGLNYEFGDLSSSGKDTALAAGSNKSWGTLASAQDPNTSSYVTDSWNLDNLFSGGNTSITVSALQINKYTSADKTAAKYINCTSALSYTTLETGHTYNVMINPDSNSCAIEKVN